MSVSTPRANSVPKMTSKMIPKIEDMLYVSVECLLNYLRFYSFPSISEKEKHALFLSLHNTPLRSPEVFPQIVDAVKRDDFAALKSIVNMNRIDLSKEIEAALGKSKKPYPDSWPLILDCYFAESNSGIALDLLAKLISFPILDEKMEALSRFIAHYKSSTPEVRQYLVSGYNMRAVDI
jgi:hypothetical protein